MNQTARCARALTVPCTVGVSGVPEVPEHHRILIMYWMEGLSDEKSTDSCRMRCGIAGVLPD